MVGEIAAAAWLAEWGTVTVAGAILQGVQTQLQPDEMKQVLKSATQAAQQKAHRLFYACPPDGRKGVKSFLEQFFQSGEIRAELQKPLQDRGKPSVDMLVAAFEQQAAAHSTMQAYQPQFLQPWIEEFVENYFKQLRGIKFQVAKQQYLDALVNSCDDVKFVGIDAAVRERDRSAKLLDIFVLPDVVAEKESSPDRALLMREMPESVEENQVDLWLEQRERFGRDRGTSVSAHQLLSATRRKVVLLGDPGSGKTTLMRYFAVKLARNEASEIGLPQGDDWFPILIYLRDWAKQPERSLPEQLEHFAKTTLHVDLPVGFFQHWLAGRSP